MEYAEHGSLLNYLRSLRPPGTLDSYILKSTVTKDEERVLPEETMWDFAAQIMRGMKHLLSHKVKDLVVILFIIPLLGQSHNVDVF